MKKIFTFFLMTIFLSTMLYSQDQGALHFDMTNFPQWTRDLRRAEIIAFGSFPFTYFFTNFSYDFYRMSNNNWDRRYAPWPITAPGAFEKSNREKFTIIGVAAGTSILLALIDNLIETSRRNRIQRHLDTYPESIPVIITRPLDEEND